MKLIVGFLFLVSFFLAAGCGTFLLHARIVGEAVLWGILFSASLILIFLECYLFFKSREQEG